MAAEQSIINWAACPVLESVPGKLGGAWVFRGTRVPYTTVLDNISDMSVGEIAESFPSIRRDQIVCFLDFVARSAARKRDMGNVFCWTKTCRTGCGSSFPGIP